MVEKTAILYPSVAMALLTLAVLFSLGFRRFIAVQQRKVSLKYYRTYVEGGEPESLRQHSRHAQNHFEVPPLFHLAVVMTYLTDKVTPEAIYAAWFFFLARGLHSAIHLSYNNVSHRFFVFGLSALAALYLWARLLLALA